MPKMKTHRGAAKRFKKTGTGKIVRAHSNRRHILTKKAAQAEAPAAQERAGVGRRRAHACA